MGPSNTGDASWAPPRLESTPAVMTAAATIKQAPSA